MPNPGAWRKKRFRRIEACVERRTLARKQLTRPSRAIAGARVNPVPQSPAAIQSPSGPSGPRRKRLSGVTASKRTQETQQVGIPQGGKEQQQRLDRVAHKGGIHFGNAVLRAVVGEGRPRAPC